MINNILNGIFDFVLYTVNVILFPINHFIEQSMPGLDSAMDYIGNFFTYIGNIIPFVISYFGLNQELLTLIVAYLTFKITLPITAFPFKLGIKWYNALKP